MWKCKQCGEENENNFDSCWNCGTEKDGTEQVVTEHHETEHYRNEHHGKASSGVGLGLCPFSWIQVTKPAGCLSSLFGGQGSVVSEPQPCMTSRCQLWDSAAGNCGIITRK